MKTLIWMFVVIIHYWFFVSLISMYLYLFQINVIQDGFRMLKCYKRVTILYLSRFFWTLINKLGS